MAMRSIHGLSSIVHSLSSISTVKQAMIHAVTINGSAVSAYTPFHWFI